VDVVVVVPVQDAPSFVEYSTLYPLIALPPLPGALQLIVNRLSPEEDDGVPTWSGVVYGVADGSLEPAPPPPTLTPLT